MVFVDSVQSEIGFLHKVMSQFKGVGLMKGVQFVTNDRGKKTAVLIDLKEWGEMWEDFYDIMVFESRKHEPTISWEVLKAEMKKKKRN